MAALFALIIGRNVARRSGPGGTASSGGHALQANEQDMHDDPDDPNACVRLSRRAGPQLEGVAPHLPSSGLHLLITKTHLLCIYFCDQFTLSSDHLRADAMATGSATAIFYWVIRCGSSATRG